MAEWRRIGECVRCGECCIGDPGAFPGRLPVVQDYCPGFRWVDEAARIGECVERDSWYYLHGCITWPTKPEHIVDKPHCSFRFERL